jgi:hypothetical protein
LRHKIKQPLKIVDPISWIKGSYRIEDFIVASAKAPKSTQPASERRSNTRYPLGLPVRVHLAGTADPITVELMDISAKGGRFRGETETVRLDQIASFAFVLPGQRQCSARGRVVRSDGAGEFVLRLEAVNKAFLGFVSQLAT